MHTSQPQIAPPDFALVSFKGRVKTCRFSRAWAIVALSACIVCWHSVAVAQTVSVDTDVARQVSRYYGSSPTSFVRLDRGARAANFATSPILPYSTKPAERFRPQPVVIGSPLIEPRGIVKGNGFLYISDEGKDETHHERATIWRLDPFSKKLDVFYRGELLINSKWLWYLKGTNGRADEVVVSDYGEEPILHWQGTGVGAKVFAIEVLPDGTAGSTRIIYQGAPLRSPQGVTVVGDTVILADIGGGEMARRFDAPEVEFQAGAVFAIPLGGGSITRLFQEHTFVKLVGTCIYKDEGSLYLRMWDIDGGRRDTSRFAVMPHSGYAALSRAKVESVEPLRFGPIQNVPFVEEFPINITLHNIAPSQSVILQGQRDTTFSGGSGQLALTSRNARQEHAIVIAESPLNQDSVVLVAKVFDPGGDAVFEKTFVIPKQLATGTIHMMDNKHAGARPRDTGPGLDATVDGISETVTLFPRRGGIPVDIWQGAPLVTPMASQFSWDEKWLWVTDLSGGPNGTGAVWQIPVPSDGEQFRMYSPGNAWKYDSDHNEF